MKIKSLISAGSMLCALLGGAALVAAPAYAAPIVLDFAGLNGNAQERVGNFYNGGTGSQGSHGTNYGISFGSDAISCSGQPAGTCNSALIPGGAGANLLYFTSGPGDVMNVAAGFDTGFSFFYTSPSSTGSVQVFSGLNGTGSLLASITLPITVNGASVAGCLGTNYCPYSPSGVNFAGIAQSVIFSGAANGIAFASITLGSATAGNTVPEPGTLALLAIGVAGAIMRKRKAA